MNEIKNEKEKVTLKSYPLYIPDNVLIVGKLLYEKLNALFSYKIICLDLRNKAIEEINDIIVLRKCPNFNHTLYYINCFNPLDEYKITYVRICHLCNLLFILSGRFNTKLKYQTAYEYFNKQSKSTKR